MKVIEMSKAKSTLAEYARHVASEPVIVTSDGKPVAALFSIDDSDLESISLSTNPDFLAILEQSRARFRTEGGITGQEMRSRLGLE
jgi:prevent-host-death family protein